MLRLLNNYCTVTGIAGEKATFSVGNDFYYREEDSKYILRPEFFESLYIMHESKIYLTSCV